MRPVHLPAAALCMTLLLGGPVAAKPSHSENAHRVGIVPAAVPQAIEVGVIDTARLFSARSDYPFLAAKVLPGIIAAKKLALVVTKSGLLFSAAVKTVDITDDVLTALSQDSTIAAMPLPVPQTPAAPPTTVDTAPHKLSPISLIVTRKDFHSASQKGDDVDSYFEIFCLLTNSGVKEIQSVDGIIEFDDLAGNSIFSTGVIVSQSIAPHKDIKWLGKIKYSEFMEEDQKLKTTDLKDMKVKFIPHAIVFSDGTTEQYE